ncbi:MAG: hypothetical protein JST78_09790 [Bacteroidetes bacterium]|nr:hypothetical protein [Bacteroidota bacterium]
MKLYFGFFLLFVLSLTSCSERDSVTNHDTVVDVYVSGQKDNHAVYWKNNQLVTLDDTAYISSEVDTLVVKNQKVYVLGSAILNDGVNILNRRLLWINGVMSDLNVTYATDTQDVVSIGALDVVGTDLYISGIIHDLSVTPDVYRLVYWKNGERTDVAELSASDYNNTAMAWQDSSGYFSVAHPSLDSGMYIDTTFHPYVNMFDFGYFHSGTNGLYVFGTKEGHPYYQVVGSDAVTNTDLNGSFTKLSEFASSIYGLHNNKIYRNAAELYYTSAEHNGVQDFQWANNSLYTLEYNLSGSTYSYFILQNGVQKGLSAAGETYKTIFVNIY